MSRSGKSHRPSRDDLRQFYWKPERAAERSSLKRLGDEYNAAGDIEESYTLPSQHRHGRFRRGWWS
ncbi:hypothetical protein [Arthrobacter sp. zg-Y1110]|uniref:hypothetical protein n=1 Tax=Arthrobacter sp. zg-Y1110 TaxID=2886932 RepID=UPI001D1446B2|nr:hypothetical protein [Arthrobacter sp. zg-Y1110]MCC3292476.1 hypothetical protein [Arthrobacter sp. zg-Y1110]UWX87091.1 hypothetical protein N2K99_17220 [Arthrobacter sp. zg-Y1110]